MELKSEVECIPQQEKQQLLENIPQQEREGQLEDIPQQEKQQQQETFHVLAVDDSLIDRKILENLLRVSSYQGTKYAITKEQKNVFDNLVLFWIWEFCHKHFRFTFLLLLAVVAVTCVDSGDKALEYLGLIDNLENNSNASPSTLSTKKEVGFFLFYPHTTLTFI